MTNDTLKLTDQEVLQRAHTVLAKHVPLQAEGDSCTTDDLLDVLLGVAANRGTVEAVCADLVGTPDAETIRGYFKDQRRVEDLPELERRLNAIKATPCATLVAVADCDPERARAFAAEHGGTWYADYHDLPGAR